MKFLHLQRFFRAFAALAVLSLSVVFSIPLQANPKGEIVINGSFKIEDLGDTLKIMQQSDKGIIHWDDFSIKSGEITQFIQPSSSSSVLNRVTGSARSDIMGQLLANGNVILINPNGILIGPTGRVDVGGLILSTLDLADDDFLRGGDLNFGGTSSAPIANYGTINAAQGDVIVMAQRIENHGLIGALDGRVVLAAGNEVLVQQGKDGNIFLSGEVGKGHILNNGEVVAADVSMLARNNNVYAMAVQNNGIARAQEVDKSGGRVRLIAQGLAGVQQAGTVNVDGRTGGRAEIISDGAVVVTGSTTARGTERGGEIVIGSLATKSVNVGAGAAIDASTLMGQGGKVEIKASEVVRNDGLISAANTQGAGGSVRINSRDLAVGAPGEINVSGGTSGGVATVAATGDLLVEGKAVATGASGMGGTISLTGDEVSLGASSSVDVSGAMDGGSAFVGGGFGGQDASLRNSSRTSVASGAVLRADGGTGNGGLLSLWSDGDIDYQGTLSARGGNNGGFAEVSGKNQLTFTGGADLAGALGSNGTLLLDPVNARIGVGPGAISPTALLNAWNSGNVIVHTGPDSGPEIGNIVIESNVQIVGNSSNSLTFFAHNNITVGPSEFTTLSVPPGPVRILNQGTGNINLVSGWDGFGGGAYSAGATIGSSQQAISTANGSNLGVIGLTELLGTGANPLANSTRPLGDYGLQGAIQLNPNGAFQVHIGSAGGQTNLLAKDITMTPGDGTLEFVQIGWLHDGSDSNTLPGGIIDGDINVYAKGNLVANNPVLPGTDWRYLQIGHGGRLNSAATGASGVQDRILRGDISVNVAGGLTGQSGGTNNGWFKIGHGGKSDGNDVRINTYGNIDVNAGSMIFQVNAVSTNANALDDNFIQIGHGGVNVRGEHAGNINLNASLGDITVVGTRINSNTAAPDTVERNFFQIGHGGFNSDHIYALPVDFNSRVIVGDEITTLSELRQAISDGEDLDGSYLRAANNLMRRNADGSYVVRTVPLSGPSGKIGHAGNINVSAVGNVTLEAGGRQQSFAQIGHGGILTAGEHGSWDWDGAPVASTTSSAPTALAGTSVITLNGTDSAASLFLRFGDVISGTGIPVGSTVTSISADGKAIGISKPTTSALAGNLSFARERADGDISITSTGGAIALTRNLVERNNADAQIFTLGVQSYVQVGHGGFLSSGGFNGDITIDAGGGDVSLHGGQSNAFAKIGHGGIGSFDVTVATFNVPTPSTFLRGVREWHRDFASGDIFGNINVSAEGDLIQRSGFRGTENFAQIGHGGFRVFATDDFATSRDSLTGQDTTFKGNDMNGDGEADTFGSFVGNITVDVKGMVDAYAGQKNANHQDGADSLLSGQELLGMAGNRNFVMIGHGGIEARSDANGAIAVTSLGDLRMGATGGFDAFDASANLSTDGDTGIDNFALLGHGGRNADHFGRGDNPFDGDQRNTGAGGISTGNSVENFVLFDRDKNLISPNEREAVKLSSLTNTQIAAGRLIHFDSPIGWQVDTVAPVSLPVRDGTNLRQITLQGVDTVSSLNIAIGTAVTGTAGIPAGSVVTNIISPTVFEISLNTTATLAGVTFLTTEAGTPLKTTVAPLNSGNVLTLQGLDTTLTRNIAVGTAISGPGIPLLAYVTKVNSPTEIEISHTPTGALTADTLFTTGRFNIDNPADRSVTTVAPVGANATSVLNLGGNDTWRNLFLEVGSEVGGTGIAPNTTIVGFDSPTAIRLSSPLTATAAGNYTFAGNKLATQPKVGATANTGDYFGFENQTGVYQITNITKGTGANVGERLIAFQEVTAGGGLQARVANDSTLYFLDQLPGATRYATKDPYQQQVGVSRNEVQSLDPTTFPATGGFDLTYLLGGTGAPVTATIAVNSTTPLHEAIATIDAALEGTPNNNFFQVTPAPDGSIRIQFQGAGTNNLANKPIPLLTTTTPGLTISAVYDGFNGANTTSYLFTQLPNATDFSGNLVAPNVASPVFSNSYNPEFPEFVNVMNTAVNLSLGWKGDVSVDAGGDIRISAPQLRNLETNPYQANSILPALTGAGTSRIVPKSAVRGFAQIGHGGSESEVESYQTEAGQNGRVTVKSGGALTLLGSDFVRELETGQNVTIPTSGAIVRTTTVAPTATLGSNRINLVGTPVPTNIPGATRFTVLNIAVGSAVSGTGIPAGTVVTAITGEAEIQISSNTNQATLGQLTFTRSALTFVDKSAPDSRDNYVMIGHGGIGSATGAKVSGAIAVSAEDDVTLQAGRSTAAFSMIGHGGRDNTSNQLNRRTAFSGDISVESKSGEVSVLGGSRDRSFAMVGHGGADIEDTGVAMLGKISYFDNVATAGTQPGIVTLVDGAYGSSLAQDGSLLLNGTGTSSLFTTNDTFEVASMAGKVTVTAQTGLELTGGQKTTGITLSGTGTPNGEGFLGRFSQIGHGGGNIDARITGDIQVDVLNGAAILKGGIFRGDSARIGHGGRDFRGSNVAVGPDRAGSSFDGDVTVNVLNGDVQLLGGDAPIFDANHPGAGLDGLVRGSLVYFYEPNILAGGGQDDYLINPTDPANFDSLVDIENSLRSRKGLESLPVGYLTGLGTAAQVSNAVFRAFDVLAGRPSQLDGDAAFLPGLYQSTGTVFNPVADLNSRHAAMAQIGHGGSLLGQTVAPVAGVRTNQGIERWDGDISVSGVNVFLHGGDGTDNFAMIGHGGHEVFFPGIAEGNVTVTASGDLTLQGGDPYANNGSINGLLRNQGSFAQVGHMFTSVAAIGDNSPTLFESSRGSITATAAGNIELIAGGGLYSHAMIGSGAKIGQTNLASPRGGHEGAIKVLAGGDIIMTPAEIRENDVLSDEAYAPLITPGANPTPTIGFSRNLVTATAIGGFYSSAQIGHGGALVNPETGLFGDIDVMAYGNLVAGGISPLAADEIASIQASLDAIQASLEDNPPVDPSTDPRLVEQARLQALFRTPYEPGSATVPTGLASDSSRGHGAYAKIGHGDYLQLPSSATAAVLGTRVAGGGIRSGHVRVSTGQDLWSAGMQIGHADPVRSPAVAYNPATVSTSIAVSRKNPTATGTGRLITTRSISNYETVGGDASNGIGGINESILATSFNSGDDGSDRVRIYMPDRAFGRNNGSVNGATFGYRDSNWMQGLFLPRGTATAGTFGTIINGKGYLDPEDDSENTSVDQVYPTLRGKLTSGKTGDRLGDELLATEFTMVKSATTGLPVATDTTNIATGFTEQGVFNTDHGFGDRYMIYYSNELPPPALPPVVPGGGSSSGGSNGFVPVPIVFPSPLPFTNSSQQADRYTRGDELVDNSVFTFESWRDGGSSGDGYWVSQEPGLSSVILPEDRPGGLDAVYYEEQGQPFRVFDLQNLTDWESGVLTYDPISGFISNTRSTNPSANAGGGAADPFGFSPSTTDDEEERRRKQQATPPSGTPAPGEPAMGAPSDDPFGTPAPAAPAMGAPSDDPFGTPAPATPAMGMGAADPFAPPTPGTATPPSN